jgi:hypothetical protein
MTAVFYRSLRRLFSVPPQARQRTRPTIEALRRRDSMYPWGNARVVLIVAVVFIVASRMLVA